MGAILPLSMASLSVNNPLYIDGVSDMISDGKFTAVGVAE